MTQEYQDLTSVYNYLMKLITSKQRDQQAVTQDDLDAFGFKALDNGQYELNSNGRLYIANFNDEDSLTIRQFLPGLAGGAGMLNSGYYQSTITEEVVTIGQLKKFLFIKTKGKSKHEKVRFTSNNVDNLEQQSIG